MPTAILRRTGHKKTVRHYEIENIHVEPPDEPEKASGKATFFLKRPEETLTISFTHPEIEQVLLMLRDLRETPAVDAARNTMAGLTAYAEHLGYSFNIHRGRMGWQYTILNADGGIIERYGNLPSEAKAMLAIERWLDDRKMAEKEKKR